MSLKQLFLENEVDRNCLDMSKFTGETTFQPSFIKGTTMNKLGVYRFRAKLFILRPTTDRMTSYGLGMTS